MTPREPVEVSTIDIEAIRKRRDAIRVDDQVYGFPCSDDPRDFSPDVESCLPNEIASHALAVEKWTEANGKPEGWGTPDFGGWTCDDEHKRCVHVLKAPWGIGVCTYRDPEAAQTVADLDALLAHVSLQEAEIARLKALVEGRGR